MFHPNRRFRVVVEEDPRSLAEKLTKKTWPIFTGFEHGGHLLLHDSYTDEEAQDYAVFINEPDEAGKYVQVAGFPFGWMDADEALTVIRDVARGAYDGLMQGKHKLCLETTGGRERLGDKM